MQDIIANKFTIDDGIYRIVSVITEACLLCDKDENILFKNSSSISLFGEISNLSEINHLFNFDICLLNQSELLTYTPVKAAASSQESFCCECLFQVDQNLYRNMRIKALNIKDYRLILFEDYTDKVINSDLRKKLEKFTSDINALKSEVIENKSHKARAESLAIRTSIINRISELLRGTLDEREIINIALCETSKVLGIYKGFYLKGSDFNVIHSYCISESDNSQGFEKFAKALDRDLLNKSFVTGYLEPETGSLLSLLMVPVIYGEVVFGYLAFLKESNKKKWLNEEIVLVENLAVQLASALNQANLFNELENQKSELQSALNELKETQIQLVQSEKMASLGQLVSGIAHEINTPLGSMNSNTDLITKCLNKLENQDLDENSQKTFKMMAEIDKINCEAIRRINEIVKSLKNFARLDEASIKEVNIHDGIDSTLTLIQHELKGKISVIKEYGDLPPIKCYPDILNQVFMNLLVNACQSIPDKGEIRIMTGIEGDKVRIRIKDTGIGIPQENIGKIFDPGFTTKGVGVGTGLGLSIVYNIIEKHNGNIEVNSEVGKGTEFIISLPVDL